MKSPLRLTGSALTLLAVVCSLIAAPAMHAQPADSTGFIGAVSLDGRPAPAGATVAVYVAGDHCGAATVAVAGAYVIELSSAACARAGAGVSGH